MATIETRKYSCGEKTVKRYKATVTLKGCPRKSKTFDRKTDAAEWAQKTEYEFKHQRDFGHAHYKQKTLNEAIQRYLDSLASVNPRRHAGVAPLLAWWSSRIGETKLGDLSKDLILQQRDQQKASHVRDKPSLPKLSNARVNRSVAALKRLLNVATDEWGWMPKNPLDGIKMLPEPTGRTRHLQSDELERLLKAARQSDNPDLHAIILLALTTGARRGEIERIRLRDIDLKQQKILLPITKNGKPRILHLVDPALGFIKEICARPGKTGDSYAFASPCEPSRPNSFRRAWKTTMKRAGLTDFRFHDLRHTAASYFAGHGAGLHQISELLGHSSYQVTRRYTHLVEKDMAAIVATTASKVFANDAQRPVEEGRELRLS